MTDYRIQIKVRNARLLRAIEACGHQPGPKFANLAGIPYQSHLLPYLNLTRTPFDAAGNLRPCAEKLCVVLNQLPGELWSEEQCVPLTQNTAEVELTAQSVHQLLSPDRQADPSLAIEREQATAAVEALLNSLPQREAQILRLRYGINGEPHTLQETAKKLKVSAGRIYQIESAVLKKLRHPKRGAAEIAITHYGREDCDVGFQ